MRKVLGAVIEKVSGVSYAAFVKANLFVPLGMADSGDDSHAEVIDRRASGYVNTANGIANADYIDMTVPYAAGGRFRAARTAARGRKATSPWRPRW